jgi:hypothetical protein
MGVGVPVSTWREDDTEAAATARRCLSEEAGRAAYEAWCSWLGDGETLSTSWVRLEKPARERWIKVGQAACRAGSAGG